MDKKKVIDGERGGNEDNQIARDKWEDSEIIENTFYYQNTRCVQFGGKVPAFVFGVNASFTSRLTIYCDKKIGKTFFV